MALQTTNLPKPAHVIFSTFNFCFDPVTPLTNTLALTYTFSIQIYGDHHLQTLIQRAEPAH